jgi:hypothetical protein
MANRRSPVQPSTPKRGRPKSANPKTRKPVAVTLRGGEDWVAWLDRLCETLARESGMPKPDRTAAIDYALSIVATQRGVEPAPPRY